MGRPSCGPGARCLGLVGEASCADRPRGRGGRDGGPLPALRRKTDVKDAEWIANLVRHGLVRASFVPPPEVRVLRELVRHRKALVGTLAAERNRTLKLLEGAGIKLGGVMSSVFGVDRKSVV